MKEKFASVKEICTKSLESFWVSPKQGIQYALFFALNITFLFNPISEKNVEVLKFTRTFGMGTMYNWDVSRVISNFYKWIILFTILIFGFWIFFNSWKKKQSFTEEEKKCVSFLDSFMVLGCANIALRSFILFSEGIKSALFASSNLLVDFVILLSFFYLIFHCSKNISFDNFLRLLVSILSFSICVVIILKRPFLNVLVVVWIILLFICILIAKLKRVDESRLLSSFIKACSVTLVFFPLMTSMYFELLNILNARNIFVMHILKYYVIASILLLCSTLGISSIIYRKNSALDFWKRLAYPVLLIGYAALTVQPVLSCEYGAHVFESANLSIPVSNFLNFGKIPVITCYPGHMMTGVWQAFLYAFLNGDKLGAIFSPYSAWLEFPFVSVLFFYFVKTVLDENTAFFATLLFPFSANTCWNYFGIGMLLALAAIYYTKKQTLFRAFLIWGAFAWCTLYRLDIGFAFFMAVAISLTIWCFRTKNKVASEQLLLSFGITACTGLFLWYILCFSQGVNPILRLLEFLKLSASNQTWAYNQIGNSSRNLFCFAYLIVPFFLAMTLVVFIFSRRIWRMISEEHIVLLLIFGFSYFFNFPRGLVRHSLAENQVAIVFWNASIFLAGALSVLFHKKSLFLPLLGVFIVFSINFIDGNSFSSQPIAENVLPKIKKNIEESRSQKKERVIFEQDMKRVCDTYRFVMDTLLNDDETFVDFMNHTFVYSAIGRECPVYVAQSPLMLSGEFTQKMFIQEISDTIEKIPVAILPLIDNNLSASLDGICNSYKYYKVSEFIYTHYHPLCKYGDFAIWGLNERFDELKEKMQFEERLIPIDENYAPDLHNYNLNYLPLLWVEKDTKNVLKNTVLKELSSSDNTFAFDSSSIDKSKGNYLHLKILNSGEPFIVPLYFGVRVDEKFENTLTFSFRVENGTHDYVVRISSDYLWYFSNLNMLKTDGDLLITEIQILEGD